MILLFCSFSKKLDACVNDYEELDPERKAMLANFQRPERFSCSVFCPVQSSITFP